MNHPNVIRIVEYFESPKFISIILNVARGKPLLTFIQEMKEQFTQKKLLSIILQLSRAIRHLKAKNIIWCNFSHDNIIYDGETIVICGFSKARIKISRTFKIDKKVLGPKGILILH